MGSSMSTIELMTLTKWTDLSFIDNDRPQLVSWLNTSEKQLTALNGRILSVH